MQIAFSLDRTYVHQISNFGRSFVTIFLITCSYYLILYNLYMVRMCCIIPGVCYLTNRLHFSVCVHCNRSQIMSQRVKKQKRSTRDEAEWHDSCSSHAVASSMINYSTHAREMQSICFIQ